MYMKEYCHLENGIWYAELDGTKGPYALGLASGKAFEGLILKNIEHMKEVYCQACTEEQLEKILDDMYHGKYINDLKIYAPHLYEEMCGIADGCGADLKDIMMLNYLEEVPNAIDECYAGAGCSAASVIKRDGLPNMIFQNMDFTDAYAGYEAVYKIKLKEKSILMYGFVGQFGGIGVNSKGLGNTINVICNCPNNAGSGVPSTAILRLILEKDTVEEAENLLHTIPRSTAGCYMVTDCEKTAVFEASANHVEKITPEGKKFLVHTNHALKTRDVIDVPGSFIGKEALVLDTGFTEFKTVERQKVLTALVDRDCETLTAEDAMLYLTSDPLNVQHGLMFSLDLSTLQSMIAICDKDKAGIYVAKGMDSERKFIYLTFN